MTWLATVSLTLVPVSGSMAVPPVAAGLTGFDFFQVAEVVVTIAGDRADALA